MNTPSNDNIPSPDDFMDEIISEEEYLNMHKIINSTPPIKPTLNDVEKP